MKKYYNQPIVEAAPLKAAANLLLTSPNGLPTGDPVPGGGD